MLSAKELELKCLSEGIFFSKQDYDKYASKGMTDEEIFDTFKRNNEDALRDFGVLDYNGAMYINTASMCYAHGIDIHTYKLRKSKGLSEEDALNPNLCSLPKRSNTCSSTILDVTDKYGNDSMEIKHKCSEFGIPLGIYYKMREKFTEKQIFSVEGLKYYNRYCNVRIVYMAIDHLGHEYSSVTEMCAVWEVPLRIYCNRRRRGWSLKDALTLPVVPRVVGRTITAPNGIEYISVSAMCRAYAIDYTCYVGRIKRGWSVEKALTTPIRHSVKSLKVQVCGLTPL